MQQLQPLCGQLGVFDCHPRHVPAGTGEARDQSARDRITGRDEDDGKPRGLRAHEPQPAGPDGEMERDGALRGQILARLCQNRQRAVTLGANIARGKSQQAAMEAAERVSKEVLPNGYHMVLTGGAQSFKESMQSLVFALVLGLIVAYMILASQFESLIHPFTILLSLPLAVPFALLALWLTGNTLNLYSALGILVLFGVVKKNAILQIDHMNNLRAKGMERMDAIMEGNRDRLRPILMTTLTLVAGTGHWALGSVDWALMGVLLIGSLPGIIIGSYCAVRVPETVLRLLLATVLILVAGKLAFNELHISTESIAAAARSVAQ